MGHVCVGLGVLALGTMLLSWVFFFPQWGLEEEEEEEEEIALSYSQSTTDQRNPYGQGEGRGQSQGKGSNSNLNTWRPYSGPSPEEKGAIRIRQQPTHNL